MRSVYLTASALALAVIAAPLASAEVPLTPRAGCALFTDPSSDATPAPGATGAGPVTVNAAARTNVAGKDITGVTYRQSDATFATVIRVPGLQEVQPGDYWSSTFTSNKRIVVLRIGRASGDPTLSGAYNAAQRLATVTVDGVAVAVTAGGQFDHLRGYVSLSVDRAGLEKAVGGPLGALRALSVSSNLGTTAAALVIDSATAPTNLVAEATDNFCFS